MGGGDEVLEREETDPRALSLLQASLICAVNIVSSAYISHVKGSSERREKGRMLLQSKCQTLMGCLDSNRLRDVQEFSRNVRPVQTGRHPDNH